MAIVKYGSIRGDMVPKKMVDYILNPAKTTYQKNDTSKPVKLIYSWNCTTEDACKKMNGTHQYFQGNKLDDNSVLGYHFKHSFVPGEIDPQKSFELGCQLIERMMGEDTPFQIVFGTHVDKKHIHNHFYINNISTLDGHKLRSEYKGMQSFLYKMRAISDEICRENGLNVIEKYSDREASKKYKKQNNRQSVYKKWADEKTQETIKTNRDYVRLDIDKILAGDTKDIRAFYSELQKMGYELRVENRQYPSIRRSGTERFIRLTAKSLGEGYSVQDIMDRIAHPGKFQPSFVQREPTSDVWTARRDRPDQKYRYVKFSRPKLNRTEKRYLYRVQFRVLYRLGYKSMLYSYNSPIQKKEVQKHRQLTRQFMYLYRNNIKSSGDLQNHRLHLDEVFQDARFVQRQVYRSKPDENSLGFERWDQRKKEVNYDVRTLRSNIALCDQIQIQQEEMENRKKEQKEENRKER